MLEVMSDIQLSIDEGMIITHSQLFEICIATRVSLKGYVILKNYLNRGVR